MVRSASADREYQFNFLTTGSPTAVGKPVAIQSWIRLGGSVRRGRLVRRGGSVLYENHILFIDFHPTLFPFLSDN